MTSNTTNLTNSVESGQRINLDEITAIVCTEMWSRLYKT